MGTTTIGWTQHSINPLRARHKKTGKVGHYCEKLSPGCNLCYSSRMQNRFGTPEFGGGQLLYEYELFLDESKLQDVLRRQKPTKFFWCDMTDMFGDWVPDEQIDQCFAVMALTSRHTHQVLTKRAERMHEYMAGLGKSFPRLEKAARSLGWTLKWSEIPLVGWPLPNVWLGVSCENQEQLELRSHWLAKTPAAVRFISAEPLLGPLSLGCHCWLSDNMLPENRCRNCGMTRLLGYSVQWVITGCESGPSRRECKEEWVRSIGQQCKDSNVAWFNKQMSINGRVTTNMDDFPADLRSQEFPK